MKKIVILFPFLWLFVFQLDAADDNRRLSDLEAKVHRAKDPDSSLVYIEQLIDEAKAVGNNEYICRGYLKMVTRSYNDLNKEEVAKWLELLAPLAEKEKLYDILFRAKQCLVDLTLLNEELEKGEKEAKTMLSDATRMNNKFGIVLGHLCLSHAYSWSYRDAFAAAELEQAYQISSEMDNFTLNLEILHGLIEVYRILLDDHNQLKYLLVQEDLLRKYVEKNPSKKELLMPNLMLTYSLLTSYYVKKENAELTEKYFALARKYFSETYPELYKVFYYKARINYFSSVGDYTDAIVDIDTLLKINEGFFNDDYNELLFCKAKIMQTTGDFPEALKLYQKWFQFDDSLHVTVLNKQIRQLENVNETEKLLLEQKRIQNNEQRSILVVILFVLVMVVGYAFYAWRIKHNLSKAEQEMRLMSTQMEAANVAKDRFMSNITQTIKEPLDVIVGGAERLVSNKTISDKQNKVLSDQIKKTSEKLMVLINNILDLSRLEAGMMKFQKENTNLISYLVEILSLNPAVTVFVGERNPSQYWVEIDKKRMTEVLDSVLVSEQVETKVTIDIQNENRVEVIVYGTKLSVGNVSQETTIRNEINRMVLHGFRGDYRVENQAVIISLPVSVKGEFEAV